MDDYLGYWLLREYVNGDFGSALPYLFFRVADGMVGIKNMSSINTPNVTHTFTINFNHFTNIYNEYLNEQANQNEKDIYGIEDEDIIEWKFNHWIRPGTYV